MYIHGTSAEILLTYKEMAKTMTRNIHQDSPSTTMAELLRTTERERLRSLVEANVEVARQFHADDFQLITPGGHSLSKDEYLSSIASGRINYLVWEPETIAVRLHGQMAIIRYQAKIEIIGGGQRIPLRRYWHTDSYEKRNERWQVVWSQATETK